MGSLFVSAQLGLEPVAGLAHLVPFKNNKFIDGKWVSVLECQFIIGYKGVAELFYRHEKSGLIDWGVVHEKDEISYEYGTNSYLKHKPAIGERGKVVGYYGIFKLSNGFSKFLYMTAEECMAHGRKHSKTFDSRDNAFNSKSPWHTNPDAMCLKTVLLQVAKTAPMSTDLRRALDTDETTREFKGGVADALELPVTTNWTDVEAETNIPKADTKKLTESLDKKELTTEELEAIRKAKAEQYAKDNPPASTESQKPTGKTETAVGIIDEMLEPNKGGYVGVHIVGYLQDNGKPMKFSTNNETILDTLRARKAAGKQVGLEYVTVVDGRWTNYNIVGLVSVQEEVGE
jgi:recombination protein RecT